MTTYIKRFLLPAQIYCKLVNADKKFAEIQYLAMILLSNVNLLQQLLFSAMSSLVSVANHRSSTVIRYILFTAGKVEKCISLFNLLNNSSHSNLHHSD